MGIRIDVKGLDTIQKQIEALRQSADPNTFEEWLDRITRAAKQLCNDPDCKRIKLIRTGQGQDSFSFSDKDAIDCVIKSIDNHLASMPAIQQGIFKKVRVWLEAKKIEFKTST